MKRILILPVVVLIFLLAASAVAEQALVDIHCDEQGYSTKMPAGKATTFQTGNGLRIWLDEPGYVPNVLIWVRSEDLEDPAVYVRDEYTDYMKKQYGTKLIGTTQYEYYDIGGKRLLGAAYIYKSSSGSNINQLHLYEIRGGEPDVEYNARYLNSERETTLAALDAAVRYYTPDNSSAGSQALETVHCAEQGFSTRMPAGKSATFQENNGLRIWLDEPGYVPNILIWRRKTDVSDPSAYIRDDYTGRMREAYGSRLVGTTHYEYYDTGGKRLFGAAYIYKGASGSTINQLHLYEVRDDQDVEYDARYVNSEREITMAALDTAVRYYTPDTAGSGGTNGSSSAAGSATTGTRELKLTSSTPIVSRTTSVSDKRFSMKVPANWKVMTASEFMTFCIKVWDPASPNRTIFMALKMEPFLKSQAAKSLYQQLVAGGAYLYRYYADAPVMKSCTLAGFLDAIPDALEYAAKYADSGVTITPKVFPDIHQASILEKKPSSLPCPASCRENVIARINFKDSAGQACEGLVTAQPTDELQYYMNGVDTWGYTVHMFMGVTCPMGELAELEPVLTECLSSFSFTRSYVSAAADLTYSQTQALLDYGNQMQAAHDAMVSAWSARQTSYDISSQKMSDAILGYDRLYDPETGEVYRAETGFYDSYNLHRQEYSNSNLQLIDSSSQKYYLESVDYYITK